jgi:hypothetical protein
VRTRLNATPSRKTYASDTGRIRSLRSRELQTAHRTATASETTAHRRYADLASDARRYQCISCACIRLRASDDRRFDQCPPLPRLVVADAIRRQRMTLWRAASRVPLTRPPAGVARPPPTSFSSTLVAVRVVRAARLEITHLARLDPPLSQTDANNNGHHNAFFSMNALKLAMRAAGFTGIGDSVTIANPWTSPDDCPQPTCHPSRIRSRRASRRNQDGTEAQRRSRCSALRRPARCVMRPLKWSGGCGRRSPAVFNGNKQSTSHRCHSKEGTRDLVAGGVSCVETEGAGDPQALLSQILLANGGYAERHFRCPRRRRSTGGRLPN